MERIEEIEARVTAAKNQTDGFGRETSDFLAACGEDVPFLISEVKRLQADLVEKGKREDGLLMLIMTMRYICLHPAPTTTLADINEALKDFKCVPWMAEAEERLRDRAMPGCAAACHTKDKASTIYHVLGCVNR